MYIPACTSMYRYIPVHTTTSTYHFIPVCAGMYQYIPVHTSTYQFILVCTSMCWYILVHTTIIHMVSRVLLIPLFLAGNSTPTIPHKFSKHKGSGFPMGCADSAASDGRRGSSVYEVNTWLWNFGSGKPRLGGLTVKETAMHKETVRKDQANRSAETCRRRRADSHRARSNEVCCHGLVSVCTS